MDCLENTLDGFVRCLSPSFVSRLHCAENSCQSLEDVMRSLKKALAARDVQLAAKQAEIDTLTASLQQTILQLKAMSETSKYEKEKHRKEERRREEQQHREQWQRDDQRMRSEVVHTPLDVVTSGMKLPGSPVDLLPSVQVAAEREAWIHREKALRQQLVDTEEALRLQQKLLHEQVEVAASATTRAERAEAESAKLAGTVGTEESSGS